MKTKTLLTILTFLFSLQLSASQTIVYAGPVDGLWTVENSPYIIKGAIFIDNHHTLEIEAGARLIFETNEPMIINGGLVAIGNINDSIRFTADIQERGWGGLRFESGLPGSEESILSYCKFDYAIAVGEWPYHSGGAIGVRYTNDISINNCLFQYNKALDQRRDGLEGGGSGGAIAIWLSEIRLSKNVFRYNEAINGGAIFIDKYSTAVIDNSLFYANSASSNGGAVFVADHATPQFINCTFADNLAYYGGAIATTEEANPYILNSIVCQNSAVESGNQIFIEQNSNITLNYSNIEGGQNGIVGYFINNINNTIFSYDPEFNSTGTFPFSIPGHSPCIDLGIVSNLFVPQGYEQPSTDLHGNQRIFGNTIDIGCFEKIVFTQVITDITDEIPISSNSSPWDIVRSTISDNDLLAVQFIDNNHGWVVGSYGTLLYTSDAGLNWSEYSFGPLIDLYDLHFINESTGFVIGVKFVGPHQYGVVYKTADGGQSWELSYESETPTVINSLEFTINQIGFLVGYTYDSEGTNTFMLTTQDIGDNWDEVPIDNPVMEIDNILFNDDVFSLRLNEGWATGRINIGPSEYDVILKSTDEGLSWIPSYIDLVGDIYFRDLYFLDDLNGIATADNGIILMTNNGGVNWTRQSFTEFKFNAAIYGDNHQGMAVGDAGAILSFYDDGQYWSVENTNIETHLNAICNTSNDDMWIVGNEGILVHMYRSYMQDSIPPVSNPVASNKDGIVSKLDTQSQTNNVDVSFVNHKNYPNPFSDRTTITFEIDHQAQVKLQVYNINGQLISTLKDQLLESGNHEVIFETSELPQGFYTYVLRTGNTVESGRMIK